MPIGCPSQSPEPKSACTGASSPIARIITAEFRATGHLSTRAFHGFDAGKTGQPAIEGGGAVEPPSVTTATSVAKLERIEHRVPSRRRLERPEEQVAGRGVRSRDPELGPEQPG